jgi:hypothetical protein
MGPRPWSFAAENTIALQAKKKGPAHPGPFSGNSALALFALVRILLAGFAGLLIRLTVLTLLAMLTLLATLALLLAGLLARLRLILMPLLLILLARLVLVAHVMKLHGSGLPQPYSEPGPAIIVPRKCRSSKGFLVTSVCDEEPGRPAFAPAKLIRVEPAPRMISSQNRITKGLGTRCFMC